MNVYPMLFSFVADHFQYLASLGIISAAVASLAWLVRSPGLLLVIGAAILAVLAPLSFLHARVFYDAESVWRDTLAKNDDAWMPHNNLASILLKRADEPLHQKDYDQVHRLAQEALIHVQKALVIKPDHHPAVSNLSEALRLLGRYDEALDAAIHAEQLAPYIPDNPYAVGRLYQLLNRNDEAIAAYQRAIQIRADHSISHSELAWLLVNLGRADEAVPHFDAVLARQPNDVKLIVQIAQRLEGASRLDLAEPYYRRAFAAALTPEQQISAGYQLARFLATGSDPARRNGPEAVRIAERVCQMTNRAMPQPLHILAAAYAESGRFDEAVHTAEEALALARQMHDEKLARDLEEKLAAYRAGRLGP